jgi:hypothetical protein
MLFLTVALSESAMIMPPEWMSEPAGAESVMGPAV